MRKDRAAAARIVDRSAPLVVASETGVGRPFIKWAGGKRQLLPSLLRHAPPKPARYFEPFIGGGALFFALRPRQAVLADVNARLIRTYRGVQNDVAEVIRLLRSYPHNPAFFYRFREEDIDARSDAEVAAWFIYLNKTGFNGLYRVNRDNRFNVPFGRYTNPTICDEPTLRACSQALASTKLLVEDFEVVVAKAKGGDFVYFDPPYVPLSATSSFTSYTSHGASARRNRTPPARRREEAEKAWRSACCSRTRRHRSFRNLYADGFQLTEVSATRAVNSKARRHAAPSLELIIQ